MVTSSNNVLKKRRIGVFGGTFDPPHFGHTLLAEASLQQLALDHIDWLLTPDPPHKTDRKITEIEDRIDMVNTIVSDNPKFNISRVDIERDPPYYAVDTLKIVKNLYPEDKLVYLMGSDSLRNLPQWYKPVEFVKLCDQLGVMCRQRDTIDLNSLSEIVPGILEKVQYLHTKRVDISASDIRSRIHNHEPYNHLIPTPVVQIIIGRHLYI